MPKYDSLVSFRAPKELKQALEEQARKERRTVSSLVMEAAQRYLALKKEQK